MALVQADNVQKKYQDGSNTVEAVKGISFFHRARFIRFLCRAFRQWEKHPA